MPKYNFEKLGDVHDKVGKLESGPEYDAKQRKALLVTASYIHENQLDRELFTELVGMLGIEEASWR